MEIKRAIKIPKVTDPKNSNNPRPTAAAGPDPKILVEVYSSETRKLTAVRANMASRVTARMMIVGTDLSIPYP